MAIVGTAYVEVKAVTDKVRGQIREGFQRGMAGAGTEAGQQFEQEILPGMEDTGKKSGQALEREVGKSGQRAAKSFNSKFKNEVSKGSLGIRQKLAAVLSGGGGDDGRRYAQKFWSGAEGFFKKVPIGKIGLAGLVSFLPQAIALIGQLGGGLVALGSAAGQAVGSVGPLYSTMVPLVSILGSVKLGLSGVSQAIKVSLSGNATPAALKKALDGLSPSARAFVAQIDKLNPKIKSLKETASKNLLPGLTAGLKGVMPLFGPFEKMIGSIDRDVGNMAKHLGQRLGGPMRGLMKNIFQDNAKSVHNLTGALTAFIPALLRIFHTMQPVQKQFTGLLKSGAQWLDLWTSKHQDTMQSYFQRSFNRMKQLASIVQNLVQTMLNVGHAASKAGGSMLDSIDKVTGGWAKMTGQVGTQSKMADYFKQTVPVMKEVTGMIGDVLKGIVSLGSGDKNLMPLLKQIRGQLMPALGNLFKVATGPLASTMIKLLTDIANVLSKLAGQGASGFLDSFASALDSVFKVINAILGIPGVGKLAGYIFGIAGAVAAYGKVMSMIKGFTLIKYIEGLGAPKGVAAAEGGFASKLGLGGAAGTLGKPTHVWVDNPGFGKGGPGGGGVSQGEKAIAEGEGAVAAEGGGTIAARALSKFKVGFQEGMKRGMRGVAVALGGDILGNVLAQHGHKTSSYAVKNASSTYGSLAIFGPEVAAPVAAFIGIMSMLKRNRTFTQGFLPKEMAAYNRPLPKTTYAEDASAQQYLQANPKEYAKYHAQLPHFNNDQLVQYVAGLRKLRVELVNIAAEQDRDAQAQKRMAQAGAAVLKTTDAFHHSLDGLKQAASANGQALLGNSQAARNNQAAMTGAVNAVIQHINAMKNNGATSLQMTRSLYKMSVQLRDQATAAFGSKKAVDAFMGAVGLIPSRIRRAMAGLKAIGLAAGGDLGRGFVLGIQQMQGAATTAAKVMADSTVKSMRWDSLRESSPSKVTHKIGQDFTKCFIHGIRSGIRLARRASKDLGDQTLSDLYKSVDKITSSLRSHRQSMSQAFGVIGQTGKTTSVTSLLDAVRGGPHAMNQEQRAIRRMVNSQIQSTKNLLTSTMHSEHSRIQTLKDEIANTKSAKTRRKYVAELAKVEADRKKVLDLRHQLNLQEDKIHRYLERLTKKEDALAAHRARIAKHLATVQQRLQNLRQAKASIEDSIKSGISGFTDITSVVPQGVKITATSIVSNFQGRLATVKQWAADIKTLIKRGLNHTLITEIINQGPDLGGQYARALVSATDAQITTLNQTQKQIGAISTGLANYVGSQFFDAGIQAAQGMIAGLKKKQAALDAAAAEMGRVMAQALKKALGIKSPSQVMRDEVGLHIPTGIAAGIRKGTPHAVRAIHQMNSKLLAASAVAMSPSLAAQQTGASLPPQINGPLLAVEHLHIRDDNDIVKLEQMLYRARSNAARASGVRTVPVR